MKTIMHTRSMNRNPQSDYRVRYGLRYIARNGRPYFSVTVEAPDRMHVSTGAAHDDVLKRRPDMADIVALHLSSVTGEPMHALANAWYWWSDYDGKGSTRCADGRTHLDLFADHVRISRDEANALDLPNFRVMGGDYSYPPEFVAWIDEQRPRWKAEADAVIEKYNLHGWND